MRKFFITILILLAGILPVRADTDRLLNSLKPAGYVSDFAGVMNSADRITVEQSLAELEKKCGAQIAVVTLQSLEGGQIDDFAARLFERWKIGQKGKDNGFLLIAAIVMNLCFLAPDSLFIASGARRLVVATARGAFLLLMLLISICLRPV